jgi:predicted AAA+ superfamily ATPase
MDPSVPFIYMIGLVFPRLLRAPEAKSFFLLGPRGTGKSMWTRHQFPDAVTIDLLEADQYTSLLAAPGRLEDRIPPAHRDWVVIDEIQKVPALLDEVHRLIEKRRIRFALTGSSARKLRRRGVNLLAGRALPLTMHPLTRKELGDAFDLKRSLSHGQLPGAYVEADPRAFLRAYVTMYLREEILQEGLTRNLGAFTRFLESISFSQASVLNVSSVARDCAVERKVVEDYVSILEDLLIAVRVPAFQRRAKRRVTTHPKFFFFDTGVYRAIRPRGPLDSPEEIDGPALETLLMQELRAHIAYGSLAYDLYHWRTHGGLEVDLVLYGERGLHAFEVKRAARLREEDYAGLRAFSTDYPSARCTLVYSGTKRFTEGAIEVIPLATLLAELPDRLW